MKKIVQVPLTKRMTEKSLIIQLLNPTAYFPQLFISTTNVEMEVTI